MAALLIRAEVDEGQAPRFCGAVLQPFAVGDNRDVVIKIVDDWKIESLKIVKGGFGIWCWDVAFQPAQIQDILARH